MLELKNINKYYNAGTVNEMCLFKDFNLSIADGEFVSVIGSNGSGKTSMLNLICGSIPVDSGTITMGGVDITKMPEYKRQRRIGRVYQHPAMGTCPTMTILENMSLADNKGKAVSMQLITTDEQKAHYCRSFWQFFADNWGKGEIMGITVLAKAYEEMSLSAEEKFCAEIAGFLDAEGRVYKNGGGVDGVYYSPKLAKGLSVAAQEINYNIVLRPHAGRTDVYLGYPVIYQTY